jgi:hypothetical protein
MASIPYTDKKLPKDQEKLAEAARENRNSGVDDKLLNPLIATEVAAGTSKFLNTPRDISKIVNSPLVQNTNKATRAVSTVGKFANTSPVKVPVAGSLFSPLFAYSIANEVTGAVREDGRDLNTLIGEGIGGAIADAKYGDGSLPAFSAKEREAMRDGLNVNKPIYGRTNSRRNGKYTIMGYEPLSQGAKNSLALEDKREMFSPEMAPKNPIRGTFTLPDGTVVMQREDGTRFNPTQEELQNFNRTMQGLNQPSVTGLGVGGSEGVIVNKGNPNDPYGFSPQEPKVEGTGMSSVADKMLADFQRFKDSGKEMTPEMEQKAIDLAASVGRKFDPEQGYSNVFEPEILEKYNQRVADGNFDPSTIGREERPSNLDLATQERRESQAQSDRSFENNRSRMEDDRRDREESGGAMIRVDGVMVPATEENRAKRDLENRLKEEARDEGLSESGVRDYVKEKLEEREGDEYQKEIDRIKDELDITTKAAELEKKRQDLLPDAPERPKPSEIKSFISNAEDQFDLVFDPETFTFNTVEDGGFWGSDKEHPLNPNSELYQKLKQVEGSEYFLSPPSDVMNIMEQSIEDAKQSSLGYVGVQADDGRVYNITAGGDITHVGYSGEEIK